MEVTVRQGVGERAIALARRATRAVGDAKFEAALFALLALTLAAVAFQDRILDRTIRLTPQTITTYSRLTHTDVAVGGRSTARELSPFHWTCELLKGFDYPYCGDEIFFGKDFGNHGLDLSNLKSVAVTLVYRGPSKSFRLHLKNYDPRYSQAVRDNSPKFNRVEFPTEPGRVQRVVFDAADFGVADWWLRKHELDPKLSHPQFNNITSIDIQTGTEPAPGHHEFEVREIALTTSILTDAQWYLSLLGAWVVLICAYLAYRIRNVKTELERREALQALAVHQAEEAEDAARHDHLTRALNRRGLAERFEALAESTAGARGLAVILIDIDHFKALNDQFGHGYGDEVLSTIATLIGRNVRSGDAVGRWGGEEFLAICPDIETIDAQQIAEKIRRRIDHFHFGDCEHVTASLGVHWCPAPGPDLAQLVSLADVALYSAKNSGRNCCRIYRPGMAKAA